MPEAADNVATAYNTSREALLKLNNGLKVNGRDFARIQYGPELALKNKASEHLLSRD